MIAPLLSEATDGRDRMIHRGLRWFESTSSIVTLKTAAVAAAIFSVTKIPYSTETCYALMGANALYQFIEGSYLSVRNIERMALPPAAYFSVQALSYFLDWFYIESIISFESCKNGGYAESQLALKNSLMMLSIVLFIIQGAVKLYEIDKSQRAIDLDILCDPELRPHYRQNYLERILRTELPHMQPKDLERFFDSLGDEEFSPLFLIEILSRDQFNDIYLKRLIQILEAIDKQTPSAVNEINLRIAALTRGKRLLTELDNLVEVTDPEKLDLLNQTLESYREKIALCRNKSHLDTLLLKRGQSTSSCSSAAEKEDDNTQQEAYMALAELGVFGNADCKRYLDELGISESNNPIKTMIELMETKGLKIKQDLLAAEIIPRPGKRLTAEAIKEKLTQTLKCRMPNYSSRLILAMHQAHLIGCYLLFTAYHLSEYSQTALEYPISTASGIVSGLAVGLIDEDSRNHRNFDAPYQFVQASLATKIHTLAVIALIGCIHREIGAAGAFLHGTYLGYEIGKRTRPLQGRVHQLINFSRQTAQERVV